MRSFGELLSKKIEDRKAVVGIIGIGYVGSALSTGTTNAGFKTIGFTRSNLKALEFNKKKQKNFTATDNVKNFSECDIICICVPTPITQDKQPDVRPLMNAVASIVENFKKGTLVVIESTIAPGMTRNLALPKLLESGFREEDEFFLSFSPERVDPGNQKFDIFNTPKVVGGLSETSKNLTRDFYKSFVKEVVSVSSLEVAEMSKVLENTFRFVNISMMNELLDYANKLGINLWETIDASATKPFGFLAHYPGPGIGGHCIPVDPYYLIDDAKKRGLNLKIIEAAGVVNDDQPQKIVDKTLNILKLTNGVKEKHSALLVGLSYKEDTPDSRESPSFKIWELLKEQNIDVTYHDPYIPQYENSMSEELSDSNIEKADIVILATPHSSIDYPKLVSHNTPVLDTKNALKKITSPNIYKI